MPPHESAGDQDELPGVTRQLSDWIHNLKLEDVPEEVRTRAKYLILDGLACALNGAHVPWSEEAAKAVLGFEEAGKCTVIGWETVSLSFTLLATQLFFHLP